VHSNPQDGRYTYHELAKELFSRHLYQRSKKEYYSTRRALVDHYQCLLEVIQMERDIETYNSAQWVELALALVNQLFLLPDEDSHTQAIKQILYAYEPTNIERTGEIARVLRELSQEHFKNQVNSSARQIAKQLLQLIEAGPRNKERLTAVSYLLEKVSHTPEFPPELLTRLYHIRRRSYSHFNEYQQAIEDCNRILELDSKDAKAYRDRGFMYMKLQDYQQALVNLDRALELDTQDALSYNWRGVCYRDLQIYQQAITDLNHALELDPELARAYFHLGVVYHELKDYQQALADLDRALKTDPQDAWAHLYRGISNRELQNYQQAITDLNHALELDPKLAQAYFQRGSIYLWLKDIEQAIDDFDCSWKLDPKDVNNGWMTEWTKMCVKRPDPGLVERLEAIAAVNPQCYEAYVCRGVVLLLRQRFEEALAELEMAIPLKPQVPDAYFWKGIVYASLGQDEEAMSMLKKALKGNLLPVLVAPFHQLKQVRSDFYEKYVISLLADY